MRVASYFFILYTLKSNLSFFKIPPKYYIKNNIEIKNRGQIIRILSTKKGYEYTYPFLFDLSLNVNGFWIIKIKNK